MAEHVVTLSNGALQDGLSTLGTLPAGLRVRTLEQATRDGEPLGALLRVPGGGGTERFAALNAALCPDVLVVDIDSGARPESALHVVVAATGAAAEMTHPRIVVRAGAGSVARVILQYLGDDAAERFVNAFVDVEVGPDPTLHLYRLQSQGGKTFQIERIDATVGQPTTMHRKFRHH